MFLNKKNLVYYIQYLFYLYCSECYRDTIKIVCTVVTKEMEQQGERETDRDEQEFIKFANNHNLYFILKK